MKRLVGISTALVFFVGFLAPSVALAQEDHSKECIFGEVTIVEPVKGELTLKTDEGEEVSLAIEEARIKLYGPDITVGDIEFEGKPAVLVTAFDITERRQAQEETLRLNQKLLSLQFAGATIAASLDLQYILKTVTREMVDLLAVEGCTILEWDQAADTISLVAK